MENICFEKIEKEGKPPLIQAELNGEMVGLCRYIDNNKYSPDMADIDCEILDFTVKPNAINNGSEEKLFKYVIDEFKNKNKKKMIIWCSKNKDKLKKFYVKMGGNIVKERTVEIENQKFLETGFVFIL